MTGRRSADRAVARLAAANNRVVTWDQLRAAGLGPNAIAHRVDVSWLHRVHHGVYLLDDPTTASRLTLFTAAVKACGSGALLSHNSAAELWDLIPPQAGPVQSPSSVAIPAIDEPASEFTASTISSAVTCASGRAFS
jgi:predicted transcriptional regulator of viral defense system